MVDSWKDCTLGPIKPLADHLLQQNSSIITSLTRSTPSSLHESSRFILQAKYPSQRKQNSTKSPNLKKKKQKASSTRRQVTKESEKERQSQSPSPLPHSKSVMSLEKTPQKSKIIRSGSVTKKKKSIEGETHRLSTRIEGLQNAIKSKEQRLNSLHKDLYTDKSTLDLLQKRLQGKEISEKSPNKVSIKRNKSLLTDVGNVKKEKNGLLEGLNVHQKSRLQIIKMLQKASKSTQEPTSLVLDRDLSMHSVSAAVLHTAGPEFMGNKESRLNQEEDFEEEEERHYRERIIKMREYLEDLRKENVELKEEMTKQENHEKLKLKQAYRIQELLETLGNKEKELEKREDFYREKIEEMGTKIIELNDQLEMSMKYQESLKKLSGEMKYKDIEISLTKDFFVNRVKNLIDEGIDHENLRERSYSDLVKEFVNIRGKFDNSASKK